MEENNSKTDYQVLASCFRVEGAVEHFAEKLNPKDVGYVHGFKGIYELYLATIEYHKATKLNIVDSVSFRDWLETESSIYDSIGGELGYSDIINNLMGIELPALEPLVKMVEYRANKRRRLDHVQMLQSLVSSSNMEDENSQVEIAKLTEEINSLFVDLNYDPLSKVRTAKDIIGGLNDMWEIPPFIKTPFKNLNRALGYTSEGGIFRGGVHTVVAMSGLGKSTFTKCCCNYWLDEGYTVLFVNFEEPESHWNRILMTQLTGVNVYAKADSATDQEKAELNQIFINRIEKWSDRLMVRHDPDTLFFEDLEQWLRDILGYGARKPDVVVIDTIQSMFTKTGGKARWGEFEQIMVRLEKLAKDMDAAFVLTAQQNINATKEKREVINQSDMGGSVTITQKSTVTMFLTPQRSSGDDDDVSSRIMEVQIPKNRITGTVYNDSPPLVIYDDETKSYYEYDPSKEDERYNVESVSLDIGGDTY